VRAIERAVKEAEAMTTRREFMVGAAGLTSPAMDGREIVPSVERLAQASRLSPIARLSRVTRLWRRRLFCVVAAHRPSGR